jgi:hypothetical protein
MFRMQENQLLQCYSRSHSNPGYTNMKKEVVIARLPPANILEHFKTKKYVLTASVVLGG